MKEQLTSFETARVAKEKGFNIYNDYFYCEKYGLCQLGEGTLCVFNHPKTNNFKVIHNCNHEFEEGERFYASTQSLLQKWLREVHQIYVDIDIDQTTAPKFCYMISRFIGNPMNLAAEEWDWENHPNGENWHLHRKWEDALEEGLFEALKLI